MKNIILTLLIFFFQFSVRSQNIIKKQKGCSYKIYYYENKVKKEEGCLVNNKKEGLWKEYSTSGVLLNEYNYEHGVPNGVFYNYFENGKIHKKGFYKNWTGIDTLTIYNTNGEIVSKSVWIPVSYKKSKAVWRKIYAKDAKPDGTIETIDGKTYTWRLGEKYEFKLDTNVKVEIHH
ncbi:MAG: hypothetical protein JST26_12960 [Bacteroidetes bacterium]|nr:hypothetical protein [Bacteroidota bacterium]